MVLSTMRDAGLSGVNQRSVSNAALLRGSASTKENVLGEGGRRLDLGMRHSSRAAVSALSGSIP